MAVNDRKNIRRLAGAMLTGVATLGFGVASSVVFAQVPGSAAGVADDSKLLLSANNLLYNRDAEVVTATGGVQINYGGYRMVAQKVQYNQSTGRVLATGNIELIEPNGNRIYSEELDVTDNFSEGFVNALRIETTDNTRLAAESAERLPDELMILNNGVYTACLPCAKRPDKAPLWQVKAERVIQNGKTHTVRLEHAKLELFGRPIAYVPFIEVPDQTIKRKSGFLFPRMTVAQKIGFGASVPYYWAISNTMDATFYPTYYTKQGFLLEAELRQRFENGDHRLRVAGINQRSPGEFDTGSSDERARSRGLVASKGDFQINPRWAFGWDVMLQSDNNFARTYKIQGLNGVVKTNEIYLTGLGKRNYFDARAYYFDVQDTDHNKLAEKKQAVVYPNVDYSFTSPEPVAGGALTINANFTNMSRSQDDFYSLDGFNRFRGIEGTYSRLTTEAEWKRTFNTPSGLLLTPLLAARADTLRYTMGSPAGYLGDLEKDDARSRYMLTAGLETRYPVLMTTAHSSHIIEPIAQLYVRPDEQMIGGVPNEDAQSLVFDATTLFERDKFSGLDRIEGGTRANVGVRYTGAFDNGYGIRSIIGQSYQLAGENSYAGDDLVNVGANSGLESSTSDYVAMAALDTPVGLTLAANARFDDRDLSVERTDASLSFSRDRITTALTYTQIAKQPKYGSNKDQDFIQSSSSLKLDENWSIFGSLTYDINRNDLIRRGVGVYYGDECTIFTVAYTDKSKATSSDANDWSINARLSFRTLGDVQIGSATLE